MAWPIFYGISRKRIIFTACTSVIYETTTKGPSFLIHKLYS